jgi:hypothetical protein
MIRLERLLLSLLVFSVCSSFAQRHSAKELEYALSVYDSKSGLSQKQIVSFCKDPNSGLLVCATANGLNYFDGTVFFPYHKVASKEQILLTEMKYYPPLDAIVGYGDTRTLYSVKGGFNELLKANAFDIEDDGIWVLDGLGDIKLYRDQFITPEKVYRTHIVNSFGLQLLPDGNFIVSDIEKAELFDPKTNQITRLVDEALWYAKEDVENSTFYCWSPVSLYRYSNGKLERVFSTNGEYILRDIAFYRDYLWISSYRGLFQLHQGEIININQNNLLNTNLLSQLWFDEGSHSLFLGTNNRGLLKLEKGCAKTLYHSHPYLQDTFGSLRWVQGELWAISAGGLLRIKNDSVIYSLNSGLYLASMNIDFPNVFFGTWGFGLKRWNFNSKRYEKKSFPTMGSVQNTAFDNMKRQWIATSEGVFREEGIGTENYIPTEVNKPITALYFEEDGTVWAGGKGGIFHLDNSGKVIRSWANTEKLNFFDLRSFHKSKSGIIYVGTYGDGLLAIKNNELIYLNKRSNYLVGKDVFSLAPTHDGYLLITTNSGLLALSEIALDEFLEGKRNFLIPMRFEENAGILNTEFNGGFGNNYAQADSFNYYFPSIQGIVKYTHYPIQSQKNDLIIREFLVDGVAADPVIPIDEKAGIIQVLFNSANFSSFRNQYFQYKLEIDGETNDWSSPFKDGKMSFSQLQVGKYKLSLRAIDGTHNPGRDEVFIEFEVTGVFYEQPWFRTLVNFVMAAVIAVLLIVIFTKRKVN